MSLKLNRQLNYVIFLTIILIACTTLILFAINNISQKQNSDSQLNMPATDNTLLQNSCISSAQIEVDSDPSLQPVGADANSLSLSQQIKATRMRVKTYECKTQYPIQ